MHAHMCVLMHERTRMDVVELFLGKMRQKHAKFPCSKSHGIELLKCLEIKHDLKNPVQFRWIQRKDIHLCNINRHLQNLALWPHNFPFNIFSRLFWIYELKALCLQNIMTCFLIFIPSSSPPPFVFLSLFLSFLFSIFLSATSFLQTAAILDSLM